MPKTDIPKTLQRRYALVEYEGGKVEKYMIGKPLYEYQINQAGIDTLSQGPDALFWTLWLAAGKPGANGEPLNPVKDRPIMETWLASLEAYEFPDVEPVPPTSLPAASPTSAA
jgi:hypothetical protein